jgi:hypothetical protein
MKNNSTFGDPSYLRKMPEYRHNNIKKVRIIGLWSAKSMVELICHILENVRSLECLILDTMCDVDYIIDTHIHKIGKCTFMDSRMVIEADKALLAVKKYIDEKVPSKVKLLYVI